MPERRNNTNADDMPVFANSSVNSPVKEAVCIDCNRVFDSCADKDCLEDLVCIFTQDAQALIDSSVAVKARNADILNCIVNVEPVNYNKGCYAVTIEYFFTVCFDVYQSATTAPDAVRGLCAFEKKCLLYGSDGNVQVFSSDSDCDETLIRMPNVKTEPTAKVKVVDPMVLSSRVICCKDRCRCDCPPQIPHCIANAMGGPLALDNNDKTVLVTLGIFSIVQLSRNVQVLVPAYDYCIPNKECSCDQGSPCDVFRGVDFPINDFFPSNLSDNSCGCKKPMDYSKDNDCD